MLMNGPVKLDGGLYWALRNLSVLGSVSLKNSINKDFPGGAVVKNPPASAGDTGSIPGPGRFHMPQRN